ncbi:MAG: hypothetical protein M0R35_05470 [Candidatus Omnitrophica bacterium]|jgi:hypothetical protein|nr:hypothetical protein [Candidatus Omnitrophota bacterium]
MFSPDKVKKYILSDNDALKDELVKAGLYIMAYETFKNNIIDSVRVFYWDGVKDGKEQYANEYKVRYSGKRCFEKSCQWFVKMKVLSKDDLNLIKFFTDLRNDIAHRFLKNICDDKFESIAKEYIQIMINMNYRIDNWWIREIEMTTNPESIPENAILEGAASVPTYLLSYIYDKYFKN